jgi:hypothetical protein
LNHCIYVDFWRHVMQLHPLYFPFLAKLLQFPFCFFMQLYLLQVSQNDQKNERKRR